MESTLFQLGVRSLELCFSDEVLLDFLDLKICQWNYFGLLHVGMLTFSEMGPIW